MPDPRHIDTRQGAVVELRVGPPVPVDHVALVVVDEGQGVAYLTQTEAVQLAAMLVGAANELVTGRPSRP